MSGSSDKFTLMYKQGCGSGAVMRQSWEAVRETLEEMLRRKQPFTCSVVQLDTPPPLTHEAQKVRSRGTQSSLTLEPRRYR